MSMVSSAVGLVLKFNSHPGGPGFLASSVEKLPLLPSLTNAKKKKKKIKGINVDLRLLNYKN